MGGRDGEALFPVEEVRAVKEVRVESDLTREDDVTEEEDDLDNVLVDRDSELAMVEVMEVVLGNTVWVESRSGMVEENDSRRGRT